MRESLKVSVKKTVVGVVVIAAAVAGGIKWFSPAPAPQAKNPVQTVSTTLVKKQNFPIILQTTGNTVPVNVVDIRPQVTNVVTQVHVKEGQMVHKGDLLFSLDDRADLANYEKAQAAADDAQRQYKRAQDLLRQQFVSQSALDTAQSNAEAAQAAARAAKAQLSYDSIRTPITGRIGIINVFAGGLVQPGNTVSTSTTATTTTALGAMATVTQLDPINVQFTIPEALLGAFFDAQRAGKSITIDFEVGGKKRQGRVYVIDNQVDTAIGAVRAKAEVSNADHSLIPGQFVSVTAVAGDIQDALVVPSQAVVMSPRGEQIYVVGADDTVSLKPVKVVTQALGQSVVTGVDEGDRVVVEGKQNLRPATKVREAEAKGKGAKPAGQAEAAATAASESASAAASQK